MQFKQRQALHSMQSRESYTESNENREARHKTSNLWQNEFGNKRHEKRRNYATSGQNAADAVDFNVPTDTSPID